MKEVENSESSDSNEINEKEEEVGDIDDDRPNLLQMNKKLDKERNEEEIKLTKKKRKRTKNKTDIVYDSNKKQIEDSFIPNLEELNDFLKNCTIKEINLEDIKEELEKIPKEKIFDPDKFIDENYGGEEKDKNEIKNNFSIEEIGIKFEQKEEKFNKEEELKEYLGLEDIEKNEEKMFINEILQEKNIFKQKNEIHKLIEKIKKIDMDEIIKSQEGNTNQKLNIVFDLDNTCIFAFFIHPENPSNLIQKYLNKDLHYIKCQFKEKIMIFAIIIRKGLKEFIEFSKDFCYFYINTLGLENYGMEIKKLLENQFNIKFKGFQARKFEGQKVEKSKFLKDLSLESKNAIIFDDKPKVWTKDNANVIISKLFTDRQINLDFLKRKKLQNNKSLFLNDYGPFAYYKSSDENWQNQKLRYEDLCPFYDFNKRNCYSGEYLESSKYQFIYMKEVIKTIYYLIYNSNMRVPEALKIIRFNIFYNSCFNMNFYNKKGKEILIEIIKNCGGVILENKNQFKKDMKLYFVCFCDDYNKFKDEINKEKSWMENAKVVSDKYIINSFYFMTNLENELDNPQYCLDLNDNDNFENY